MAQTQAPLTTLCLELAQPVFGVSVAATPQAKHRNTQMFRAALVMTSSSKQGLRL